MRIGVNLPGPFWVSSSSKSIGSGLACIAVGAATLLIFASASWVIPVFLGVLVTAAILSTVSRHRKTVTSPEQRASWYELLSPADKVRADRGELTPWWE